jgi:glycosyltransferase involved in cell wall biosynthesis
MDSPKITVILPVRDGERYLGEALESLSAQTLGDFKCLVLDDGSRDDTLSVLERHARRDKRFSVLKNENSSGIVGALNRLLSRVETPFTARMDCDDISSPDRLALQLSDAEKFPGITLWGGLVEPLGERGAGWGDYLGWLNSITTPEAIILHSLTESPLPHPTWLFRTKNIVDAGGYRDGPFPEDYELFLRLLERGKKFGKVEAKVLKWRDHPARETWTSKRYSFDAFLRLKSGYFPRLRRAGVLPHLPDRPLAVWGAGRTGRVAAGELLKGGEEIRFFIDPVQAGRTVLGIPVLAPEEAPLKEVLILTAVRYKDIRSMVEEFYREKGLVFGRDYIWLY